MIGKMRFVSALILTSSLLTTHVVAFSPNRVCGVRNKDVRVLQKTRSPSYQSSIITSKKFVSNEDGLDCGCEQTVYSGKASESARAVNLRDAIRDGTLFGLDSEEVRMDDLLEDSNSGSSTSIVVLLRSLG